MTNYRWEGLFIEETKALITEAIFNSRWIEIEGYYDLGKRIIEEVSELTVAEKCSFLSKYIGKKEAELLDACLLVLYYPDLNDLPEGKNISWSKLRKKYLNPEQLIGKLEATNEIVTGKQHK